MLALDWARTQEMRTGGRRRQYLQTIVVGYIRLKNVDVLSACEFFGDTGLGSSLVTDKTDNRVVGVARKLSKEFKLKRNALSGLLHLYPGVGRN